MYWRCTKPWCAPVVTTRTRLCSLTVVDTPCKALNVYPVLGVDSTDPAARTESRRATRLERNYVWLRMLRLLASLRLWLLASLRLWLLASLWLVRLRLRHRTSGRLRLRLRSIVLIGLGPER